MAKKYLVIAKPNSREEKVEKVGKDILRISIKEKAKKGKANKKIKKLVSKYLKINEDNFTLIGSTSKYKYLYIK